MKRMISLFTLLAVIVMALAAYQPSVAAYRYTPTSNGCGPSGGPKVPDYIYYASIFGTRNTFPFVNACDVHDVCYGTLGTNQAQCDNQFLNNLLAICSANATSWTSRQYCNGFAYSYYYAVAWFGSSAFDNAQNKAYECTYLRQC